MYYRVPCPVFLLLGAHRRGSVETPITSVDRKGRLGTGAE